MKQKHFMDIQNLIEEQAGLVQPNCNRFEPGDIIQITEKWDGSNACAAWDEETNSMQSFSRKQTLAFDNTLGGFFEYVNNFSEETKNVFKSNPNYRVFGEWGNKNKIKYRPECYKQWYVYDIYDVEKEEWLNQSIVKTFCEQAGLNYIHVLYEGPFISWDHCRTFSNSPAYGDTQEGIVVKNQSKLNCPDERLPFYLKIVNQFFKEKSMKRVKEISQEELNEKARVEELVKSIVTRNRVEKIIYKLRDENLIPEEITPNDMGKIARILPKAMYDDCVKEDLEIVKSCTDSFGKVCGSITMQHARNIILGNN